MRRLLSLVLLVVFLAACTESPGAGTQAPAAGSAAPAAPAATPAAEPGYGY